MKRTRNELKEAAKLEILGTLRAGALSTIEDDDELIKEVVAQFARVANFLGYNPGTLETSK